MSQQIGVWANAWTWSGDLRPGDGQAFISWGTQAEYGRMAWIWATPVGTTRGLPPYDQALDVEDQRSEKGADGAGRILFTVVNRSQDIVYDYIILIAYSDVVTSFAN